MTTGSQKRKAVAELVPRQFETSTAENNQPENLVTGPSKPPRVQPENLEEIKASLKKEIMSDLDKLLAENQNEMMKLVARTTKKSSAHQNAQDSDSETENISVARTSTLVKTNTATSKTTPINSRNRTVNKKLQVRVTIFAIVCAKHAIVEKHVMCNISRN